MSTNAILEILLLVDTNTKAPGSTYVSNTVTQIEIVYIHFYWRIRMLLYKCNVCLSYFSSCFAPALTSRKLSFRNLKAPEDIHLQPIQCIGIYICYVLE